MIFDNAEDVITLRPFWPAGIRGSIIITTQNPDMVHLTSSAIHLPPMSPEEGSTLIQEYLRRGASEQSAAEALSRELGGLPLAIAHFAGYVTKSQCSIEQIAASLHQRFKSSQIWSSTGAPSTSAYEYTLNTVWDLAFLRLSSDSRRLLEIIAFMNPDSIPEDMFIGSGGEEGNGIELQHQEWEYWDPHR